MTVRTGAFRRLFEGEDAMRHEMDTLGRSLRTSIGSGTDPMTPKDGAAAMKRATLALNRAFGADEDAALSSPVGQALTGLIAAQESDALTEALAGAEKTIGAARMKRLRAIAKGG